MNNIQEGASLLEHKVDENRIVGAKRSTSSEEWGEESSSCSTNSSFSGSCSDDSYIANWESHVSPDGSLFYAEYIHHAFPRASGGNESAVHVMRHDFNRASTRRNEKKNKLSRLIGKGGNKGEPLPSVQSSSKDGGGGPKVSFNENFHGEIKEVEVLINPENRYKFGRRASMTEALLAFSTSPFRNGSHLMVAGYMVNSSLNTEKPAKIGDWFKSIDDIEINAQNVNEVLSQYTKPTKVKLKFQKNVDDEQISANHAVQQVTSFAEFAKSANKLLLTSAADTSDKEQSPPSKSGLSVMILNLDLSDVEVEGNDVIFCYPNKEENELLAIRGSLLTLNSILKLEMKTEPVLTSLTSAGVTWNVCYHSFEKVLFLFGISSKYASQKEVKLRMAEMINYLKFCYDNLDATLSDHVRTELQLVCDILYVRLKKSKGTVAFETLLPESRLVSLPKEAQLRIFDALSEMEAMDYRDWNEEPLNSHREFFIFGSALFFRSYLLANLMPSSQLLGIESFMRSRGIFEFIERQTVRDFVVWLEIPMTSSSNRYFLAISSRNQLTLAVILQAFESSRRISGSGTIEEKIIGPSLFYIEEIQETLDHLRHGGIEALARVWIPSNKRPQVVAGSGSSSIEENRGDKINIKKKTEASSGFLKHSSISSDDVRVSSSMGGGSSAQSLTHSEDSNQKLEECDSDSDWDEFPDSHKSSSGFDMSEMRDSFLKEISDVVPTRITAGKDNILLHYIHLDIGTGMILAPPDTNCGLIVDKFRAACHLIHTVLQNTKKFRRLLAQETSKPNTHKSLVAIKEHGILISVGGGGGDSTNETKFWAIGRLFASPTRELYVCHKSDAPQNLVELAFRLSFLTGG